MRYCVLIQLHSITIVHTQQCRISLYHFEALSHKRIGFGITLVKLLSVLEISVSLARVSNDAFPTICLNRPILVLIRHGWGYTKRTLERESSFFRCSVAGWMGGRSEVEIGFEGVDVLGEGVAAGFGNAAGSAGLLADEAFFNVDVSGGCEFVELHAEIA